MQACICINLPSTTNTGITHVEVFKYYLKSSKYIVSVRLPSYIIAAYKTIDLTGSLWLSLTLVLITSIDIAATNTSFATMAIITSVDATAIATADITATITTTYIAAAALAAITKLPKVGIRQSSLRRQQTHQYDKAQALLTPSWQ